MTSTFLNLNKIQAMAKNLKEFLNYYGNYFNPQQTSLNGETFQAINIFEVRTDPMIVNDPLNQHNNTTRNAYRISEIQHVFRIAHQLIVEKMQSYNEGGSTDII
jgi:DNA polymerase sigma